VASLFLTLLFGGEAWAQDSVAVDVGAGWHSPEGSIPALPAPPAGYSSAQDGDVSWVFPDQASSEVQSLRDAFPERFRHVSEQLGGGIDPEMVIRVARNPQEMQALAPVGHPPPGYAVGVAYPRFGVILLTLTAPSTWTRPDTEAVLTHELSHIALHRAVEGRPLPRWFVEGVAIHQAEEHTIDRMRTLWEAASSDRVIALNELSRRFPSRPHQVNLAYAQSADVISFMLRKEDGQAKFTRLIADVRSGHELDTAVQNAFGITLVRLESEWREDTGERHGTWPLLLGGGTLWALASLLVLFAWRRRKRRMQARLDEWAEEEREVDRIEATLDEALLKAEAEEAMTLIVSGDPPQGRQPAVPTVQHDGRNHTLH
jgi:LPXTG-motif cell wall-anchored protein